MAEAAQYLFWYVQTLTGKKVHNAIYQTGVPGAKFGKVIGGGKKKKKNSTSAADVVANIKVVLLLILAMAAHPYLHDLKTNYTINIAAKVDAPVLLLKGQWVV